MVYGKAWQLRHKDHVGWCCTKHCRTWSCMSYSRFGRCPRPFPALHAIPIRIETFCYEWYEVVTHNGIDFVIQVRASIILVGNAWDNFTLYKILTQKTASKIFRINRWTPMDGTLRGVMKLKWIAKLRSSDAMLRKMSKMYILLLCVLKVINRRICDLCVRVCA